jgi:flagellar hook-associated protein 3 FlgL
MQNNSMNNVATNKSQMNTMDTQLSTQKKISRPSEDPIIAIRALRLRTSLNEINQYLKKNIPDANSWLDVSEGALNEANDIVSDVYTYCVQGSTDTQSTETRKTISEALKELRSALYSQGDVDYAGRYVFTGYKTDTPLTFTTDQDLEGADYSITQQFSAQDFDYKTILENPVDIDSIKTMTPAEIGALTDAGIDNVADYVAITNTSAHRIRLAYTDIKDSGMSVTYTDSTGAQQNIALSYTTDESKVPGDDEVLVNTVTGELLFGDNIYEKVYTSGSDFSITYEKNTFTIGDARPEHYFDCTRLSDGMKYKMSDTTEDINYIINFNQKIKVNSEARDCFSLDIGRDIDEIINAVDNTLVAEDKLQTLKDLKDNPNYSGEDCQNNLDKMIEAAEKEVELYKDTLTKAYEKGIGQMQGHQEDIDIAIADVGNRMSRLSLTESRLENQKTNFTNLKSENEDIDLEEVVINYSSAELVYNASLTAASKVVRQTLLDFL